MTQAEMHELATFVTDMLPRLRRQIGRTGVNDALADLPLAQVRVCSVLADGPRAMSDLSHELGVSLSAITQTADRLERAGMVQRIAEEGDRRVRVLCLTPQAATLLHTRREARITRVARALATLSLTEQESLCAALTAFHTACLATVPEKPPER